jgi:hypothetical protein
MVSTTGADPTVNGAPSEVDPPGSETVMVAVPGNAIRLAGTWADNCVELPNKVGSAVELKETTAPFTKPVPLTWSVKAGAPALMLEGFSAVIAGRGVMLKFAAADVAVGVFETVTGTVPGFVTALAGICAVSWLLLTKVVAIAEPAKFTVEAETKRLPVTVSVKEFEPAGTEAGFKAEIDGASMVKTAGVELTGKGLTTVTLTGPGVPSCAAGTVTLICVGLTEPGVNAAAPNCTAAPVTKPVPEIVSATSPMPAGAEDGLRLAICGRGMIERSNGFVAAAFATSVTCTVKVKLPLTVGVPLIKPDGPMESPAGGVEMARKL